MPLIGIVDDRVDIRTTLKRKIILSLKKQNLLWDILDIYPFPELSNYVNWIRENDIAILILDERLQEGNYNNVNVNYNGSKLIEFIRKVFPDFPVYAITSYPNDDSLQSRFPLFDEILSRDDFFKKSDEYTLRLTRSGQRFLDIYSRQLVRISNISKLIATGEARQEDIEELKKIQEYLNIPFTSYDYANREMWLKDYNQKLDELSVLSKKIKEFIDNKQK